jgi:hypothetical protein
MLHYLLNYRLLLMCIINSMFKLEMSLSLLDKSSSKLYLLNGNSN